jgi:ferredoxin-NADP reductase
MGTISEPAQCLVKLKRRTEVAERTMTFAFEKPANFIFKAGQFLEFTLTNPPETDAEGDSRAFSIASAPHEDMLMIATRMRDTAFKRVLGSMPLESQLKIEGPFGDLVLHNSQARAAVLLAGGIGITPFRSIVVRAAKEQLPHQVFLFYSNRRPEDAPFLEELKGLERVNPNFKFVATMTDMARSARSWDGETGYVDDGMLSRYLKRAVSPIYYIAGPPAMVTALREMLNHTGIDDDDIRAEEFAGY